MNYVCVFILPCLVIVTTNNLVQLVTGILDGGGDDPSLFNSLTETNRNESTKDRLYDHLSFLPFCKKLEDRSNKDYAICFGLTLGIITLLTVLAIGFVIFIICMCYFKRITVKSVLRHEIGEQTSLLGTESVRLYSYCWRWKFKTLCRQLRRLCNLCILSAKTEYELRREERLMQEASDKSSALGTSEKIFPGYKFQKLEDLGSRLQKYWYYRRNKKSTRPDMLQMTMKLSTVCPLEMGKKEVAVLKGVMKCLENSCLLKVEDMKVQNGSIILLVEFVKEGSLRDRIYMASPCDDWATKYAQNGGSIVFSNKEISTCGRHIIKAVLFLYEQGFPIIGQIHSGNVFKIGNRYVLGGYENTILGYRTALYSKFCEENLLEHMDEIMLGLLLYEMATGTYLEALLDDLDFQEVSSSEIKEVLQFLCCDHLRKIATKEDRMHKILKHTFFRQTKSYKSIKPFEYTPEGLKLLQCVSSSSGEIFSVKDYCLEIDHVLNAMKEKYTPDSDSCSNIGWRNGKVWAKVEGERILSAIEVPYTCPIFVRSDMDSIRTILQTQCTLLLKVYDVQYVKVDDRHIVVIVKQFVPKGSLRDWIHRQHSPLQPWDEKYATSQLRLFSLQEIAKIGSQVLRIVHELRYIHGDLNDPLSLLFIHSGNIFWDGKQCRLSGVENMLLGCRPRDYVKYKHHLHHIDELMFGNLIFELATGEELKGALPSNSEYECVHSSLKIVLKKIFEDKMTLEEISFLTFFTQQHSDAPLPKFKGDVKLCLERVKKGKYRDQDNELGKTKYRLFQRPIRRLREAIPGGRRSITSSGTSISAEAVF